VLKSSFQLILVWLVVSLSLLAYAILPASCEDFSGQVVRVLDGDTIEVLHDGYPVRIRLQGIDCPEKSQAFGSRAKELTAALTFGQQVSIREVGHDRYGRIIAEVTLSNGTSVNRELVRRGLAWWYRHYSNDLSLGMLENEARRNREGLWSDPTAGPPWEYRKVRRIRHRTAGMLHSH